MNRVVTSTMVARRLVRIGKRDNAYFTPFQLMCMVYFAHGWGSVYLGRPLVTDEKVNAWKHGAVFPELFYLLKGRGKELVMEVPKSLRERHVNANYSMIPRERELLDSVYRTYGKMSDAQFHSLVHGDETPWRKTEIWCEVSYGKLKEYFSRLAERDEMPEAA